LQPADDAENGVPVEPDTLVVDICLKGVILSTFLALHYFRKNSSKSGKVVITSSQAGLYAAPAAPLYASAKHGVS